MLTFPLLLLNQESNYMAKTIHLSLPDIDDPRFEIKAAAAISPYLAQRMARLNLRILRHLCSSDASRQNKNWHDIHTSDPNNVSFHILAGAILLMLNHMLLEWEGDPVNDSMPHDLSTPLDKAADIVSYMPLHDRQALRAKWEIVLSNMGLGDLEGDV